MSDLRERIEFYVCFLEGQVEEAQATPPRKNDYVRGLEKGYEGAFSMVARWLREELEALDKEAQP